MQVETVSKFEPKKQHLYARAKLEGKWFTVSHFFESRGVWFAWLHGGHGRLAGAVTVNEVQAWERAK